MSVGASNPNSFYQERDDAVRARQLRAEQKATTGALQYCCRNASNGDEWGETFPNTTALTKDKNNRFQTRDQSSLIPRGSSKVAGVYRWTVPNGRDTGAGDIWEIKVF
jgi:hypothetical protein